jgi:cytochrome P450
MTMPPGPVAPAVVQRAQYLRDPLGYIDRCQRRFGDVFTLRLIKRGMVLVCSPDLAKEVYTASDDVLVAGEAKIAIFGKILGQSSTVLLDGDDHVRRRRLLLPRFRGEMMQTFGPVAEDACRRMLAAMPVARPFALHPFLHRLAFDVIARALFSDTPPALRDPLLEVLSDFANVAVTSRLVMLPALQIDLGPLSPWGRVMRVVQRTRSSVLDEIQRRRRSAGAANDLTGVLTTAQHADGSPLSDDEVRDEILTIVAAGHETTAMALTWLCHAVFTRPAVLARLGDELAARRRGGEQDLDQLPYLDAVVRESLRFHSLIPNGSGRIVRKTFRLGGYEVPAGAMVSVAFHALHRRPEVFERADEFWPERFLSTKYTPYQWAPFGGGSRRCLGMPFALFEIKLVLAMLVERACIDVQQTHVRPMWRGAFLTPSKGLRVRVSHRVTDGAARSPS